MRPIHCFEISGNDVVSHLRRTEIYTKENITEGLCGRSET